MAEAGVATASPSARFFCHKCNVEITPQLPEYVCPRCNSGFIEELERGQGSDSDSSSDMETEPFDMWEVLTQDVAQASQGASASPSASSSGPGVRRNQRFRLRDLNPRHARRRVNGGDRHSALAPLLHDLIMQTIEASLEGANFASPPVGFDLPGFPVLVASNLASNPGDYAWGRGGLDAIITQLMNQLDGTGPPPLDKDQISQIPTVSITKEQFDQGLQCSVCMEDFKEDERVRRLHCEHCYHNDCIIPWLELHGTCPVCRKLLIEDGQFPIGGNSPAASSSSSSGTGPGPRSPPSSQAGAAANSPPTNSNASSSSSSTSNNTPSSRSDPPRPMFEDELD